LAVLAAAAEIDSAAISVVKTKQQQAMLADALNAAERALTLSTKRYQEGYSDFQRVLTAQQSRAARSASYVANQGAHISSVIAFYKALGGGWRPATNDDLVPEAIRAVMNARTDWGGMLESPLPVVQD
jgi:outer membrane protein TolC